jgi:hypothetical protein
MWHEKSAHVFDAVPFWLEGDAFACGSPASTSKLQVN